MKEQKKYANSAILKLKLWYIYIFDSLEELFFKNIFKVIFSVNFIKYCYGRL